MGSSSVKVALVNAKSNQKIAVISEPEYEMQIHSQQTDWAEQNPEMWWEHLCRGTKRIISENNIQNKNILAIGISYQMHGLVVLDKKNKCLRNAIIWCDSRAISIGEIAAQELGEKKYGSHLLNAPGNFTASKLKWVKENEPLIYEQIEHYMLPGDFIAYKLSNEITTTKNGLSEGILWDYKENKVADWLLNYYGIDARLTPSLVENFEIQGRVTQTASFETGLPKNIPIRYRAGDQPNNAWALNISKKGEVAATAGTSGVLFAITDRIDVKEYDRLNHFAHVNYTNENPVIGKLLCVNGAGIQYSWLKKIFSIKTFNEMNSLASKAPVGSSGLVNLPFGNGAERMLNNRTPGAQFCNLNLNLHEQGHLYRSALEGVAFSFAYGMDIMREDKLDINVIRAGNDNMFRSEIFSNTLANLIGQPIEIYNTTGAIGAARAAGVDNESLEDYINSIGTMDSEGEFVPKKDNEFYLEAYLKWKKELETALDKLKI